VVLNLVLHLPADVLKVALSKERDEQTANRVVGRGTVPTVLRACALVVVAVLVAAWDARVVLTDSTVAGSPGDDRPCEAETARRTKFSTVVYGSTVLQGIKVLYACIHSLHTTAVQCMQTLSMYSMGHMLTRACTLKGTSSYRLLQY
jgi:hypothetical protein